MQRSWLKFALIALLLVLMGILGTAAWYRQALNIHLRVRWFRLGSSQTLLWNLYLSPDRHTRGSSGHIRLAGSLRAVAGIRAQQGALSRARADGCLLCAQLVHLAGPLYLIHNFLGCSQT